MIGQGAFLNIGYALWWLPLGANQENINNCTLLILSFFSIQCDLLVRTEKPLLPCDSQLFLCLLLWLANSTPHNSVPVHVACYACNFHWYPGPTGNHRVMGFMFTSELKIN